MNREYSAGAVIFRKEKGCHLFLMIYSGRNRTWGFPKGHIGPGESERDAALREVKEETGIGDLSFVDGFREELVYKAMSNRGACKGREIEKHSVYFLCETKTESVETDGTEIAGYKWCSILDARPLITFDIAKDLLEKACRRASVDMTGSGQKKRGHAMALLKISIAKKSTGVVIVTLKGEINGDTYMILEEKLKPVLKTSVLAVVFDMKEISYVSSMGISAILTAKQAIERDGGHLILVNMQPQIVKLFKIVKTLLNKDMFKTVEELDAYLAAVQRKEVEKRKQP